MVRGQWASLARMPGLHPTLFFRRTSWNFFDDHRESGPRFNVSSEGRCFLTV